MSSCVLKFIILPVFCLDMCSINHTCFDWYFICFKYYLVISEISDFHFKRCQEKTLRIYTDFWRENLKEFAQRFPWQHFRQKFNSSFFYISHQKLSRLNLVPNKNWKFQCFPSNMILHQLYLFRNIVDSNFFGTRRSAKQKHPDKA